MTVTSRRLFMLIGLAATLFFVFITVNSRAQDSLGPPDHPPPLSPEEELKKLKVADGLEIKLVAAEPEVAQPLSICFDDRGRMWVLQYRQYPSPNGLKPVAVDQYLRTKYDRLPEPPPKGPKGKDRISIYEDTDGDGRADVVKDFVADLNLASGMALDMAACSSLSRRIFCSTPIATATIVRMACRRFYSPASAWRTHTPLPTR